MTSAHMVEWKNLENVSFIFFLQKSWIHTYESSRIAQVHRWWWPSQSPFLQPHRRWLQTSFQCHTNRIRTLYRATTEPSPRSTWSPRYPPFHDVADYGVKPQHDPLTIPASIRAPGCSHPPLKVTVIQTSYFVENFLLENKIHFMKFSIPDNSSFFLTLKTMHWAVRFSGLYTWM